MILLLGACGASERQTAVRHALTALNTASAGFSTWDKQHQESIVRDPSLTSLEDGEKRLTAYRAAREPVLHAVTAAYAALALAALEPTLANLSQAAATAKILYDEIAALRTGGP